MNMEEKSLNNKPNDKKNIITIVGFGLSVLIFIFSMVCFFNPQLIKNYIHVYQGFIIINALLSIFILIFAFSLRKIFKHNYILLVIIGLLLTVCSFFLMIFNSSNNGDLCGDSWDCEVTSTIESFGCYL